MVDERSSFVDSQTLSTRDAFILDMVCQPLLNDPSFPYAEDLRLALAKIDRSFQSSSTLSPQLYSKTVPRKALSQKQQQQCGRVICHSMLVTLFIPTRTV